VRDAIAGNIVAITLTLNEPVIPAGMTTLSTLFARVGDSAGG